MAYIISKESAAALLSGREYKKQNTQVSNEYGQNTLRLWGNRIAWLSESGILGFSLCGWDSRTTCERLRALGLPIWHKRGGLYCGDDLIESRGQYVYLDGKAQKIN
jgi:hypothetical protein